ncbi:hypothetical protein FVE85_5557 [Porphyridium purpureum]|uniref:Uncharacterized protein n=1 Tax=Porphyridium purpureum TaxID=35688 RepID=A0A5J4Z491_PORPP|nr:hypothetical protein FVE85_5557 [Porphyridium purpureum]|eukprot:POR2409..scf295_1
METPQRQWWNCATASHREEAGGRVHMKLYPLLPRVRELSNVTPPHGTSQSSMDDDLVEMDGLLADSAMDMEDKFAALDMANLDEAHQAGMPLHPSPPNSQASLAFMEPEPFLRTFTFTPRAASHLSTGIMTPGSHSQTAQTPGQRDANWNHNQYPSPGFRTPVFSYGMGSMTPGTDVDGLDYARARSFSYAMRNNPDLAPAQALLDLGDKQKREDSYTVDESGRRQQMDLPPTLDRTLLMPHSVTQKSAATTRFNPSRVLRPILPTESARANAYAQAQEVAPTPALQHPQSPTLAMDPMRLGYGNQGFESPHHAEALAMERQPSLAQKTPSKVRFGSFVFRNRATDDSARELPPQMQEQQQDEKDVSWEDVSGTLCESGSVHAGGNIDRMEYDQGVDYVIPSISRKLINSMSFRREPEPAAMWPGGPGDASNEKWVAEGAMASASVAMMDQDRAEPMVGQATSLSQPGKSVSSLFASHFSKKEREPAVEKDDKLRVPLFSGKSSLDLVLTHWVVGDPARGLEKPLMYFSESERQTEKRLFNQRKVLAVVYFYYMEHFDLNKYEQDIGKVTDPIRRLLPSSRKAYESLHLDKLFRYGGWEEMCQRHYSGPKASELFTPGRGDAE